MLTVKIENRRSETQLSKLKLLGKEQGRSRAMTRRRKIKKIAKARKVK